MSKSGGSMKRLNVVLAAAALLGLASTAIAQSAVATLRDSTATTVSSAKTVNSASMSAEEQIAASPYVPPIQIQNFRAVDQRGINVFEAPKTENVPYEGFKLLWGAAFTQQFQG